MLRKDAYKVWLRGLVIAAALFVAAVGYCTAVSGEIDREPPDLSLLDSPYLLPEGRQVFPLADGGWLAVSTDGKIKSCIAELHMGQTGWDVRLGASLRPNFQKVCYTDGSLYLFFEVPDELAEGKAAPSNEIKIVRYGTNTQLLESRLISNAVCDYQRTCLVEPGGRILLVHAPSLAEIDDLTPLYAYRFDSAEYILTPEECLPQFPEEGGPSSQPPVESGNSGPPPESEPSSQPPPESGSSTPGLPAESGASSSQPEPQTTLYLFDAPLTVAELEKSYTETSGVVRVTGADGRIKTTGRVATGDILEVLRDGRAEDRAVACIPGDLTGRGKPASADTNLLYTYLTAGCYLSDAEHRAGDLNGDGVLSTGDLLLLKELIWKSA